MWAILAMDRSCFLGKRQSVFQQAMEAAEEKTPLSIGSKTAAFMAAVNSSGLAWATMMEA